MGGLTGISKSTLHVHETLNLNNSLSDIIQTTNISAISVYIDPSNDASKDHMWRLEGNVDHADWVTILDNTDTDKFVVGRTPPLFDIMRYREVRIRMLGVVDDSHAWHIHMKGLNQKIDRIGENLDAFGRFRVSNPYSIFDSKQIHTKQTLVFSEVLNGSGTSTFEGENSSTILSVVADEDYVIRQTKMRFNYAPGKSQLGLFTGRMEFDSGVFKAIGLIDHQSVAPYNINEGLYFSAQDGYIAVNVTKNGNVSTYKQEDWNIDQMDGIGPSGKKLDPTKAQIFVIDYEWLGIGRIRFGFFLDGTLYYVHKINNANEIESPYTSKPNLPVSYEIRSTGGSGNIRQVCSSVISEGGVNPNGNLISVGNDTQVIAQTAGNNYAILGIRLKQHYRDETIIPLNVEFLSTTLDSFLWYVAFNPTINGVFSYTDMDAESALQIAYGATANTVSDLGYIVSRGFVSNQNRTAKVDLSNAIKLGVSIDGVQDTYVLIVKPLGNNMGAYGAINVRQL